MKRFLKNLLEVFGACCIAIVIALLLNTGAAVFTAGVGFTLCNYLRNT